MNRTKTGFMGLVLLCAGLEACGSSPTDNAVRTDQKLEVFNWWTNPGEIDALGALLDLYAKRHVQTKVVNTAVATLSKAQEELQSRMASGNPPGTFQSLGGWGLLKWVVYNGENDLDSKMEPIDFIARENKLADVVPASVMDLVSYGGKVYGIPLGVHRYNCLLFNKQLFSDNGLSPPATLAEFYTVSEAFKAKGLIPLAVGSKDGHQIKLHVWDGLLVAKGSVEFRDSYLSGHEDPVDARIIDTLNEYAHMLEYSNADRASITWDGAAQMVVDGKAAMTIVGDFGRGFFLSKGWRTGIELGQVPLPGTSGTFVYIVDSFGLPRGIADRQAAVNFLNLIATSEAQNVFNPIKGATPPRRDIDRSSYDSIAQSTMDDLAHDTLARATNQIVKSPEFIAALNDAMHQFAVDRNVDAVVNILKNRYDQL